MTFEEILNITKNRIDETYEDPQVDIIIKSAINHAYLFDLSNLDPVFRSTELFIVEGKAKLPNNLRAIQKFGRELVKGEYRKGRTFFSPRDNEFLKIEYETIPEPLEDPQDEPILSEDLQYLLTSKACETYFQYRKKTSLAGIYRNEYETGKAEFMSNIDDSEETVSDYYGGDL